MSKSRRGFTLVELLAVIVILAVILVIAVPQVMNAIKESRKGALISSAKLIAGTAETTKISNDTLGIEREITCENVSSYAEEDYTCDLRFENNKPYVTLVGHGKFEGMYVCDATKENAVVTFESCSLVTLSVELNGGSDTVDYEEKYEAGSNVTIETPTKVGNTFAGWTVTGEGSSFDENSNVLTIGTEDVTLTANWTINTYTINYELGGGTNAEGNPTSGTYGSTVTINNPTKEGYSFARWTINEGDGDGLVSGTNLTIGASNVIVTANWTINTYTINYELGGGTNAEGNPTSATYGETVTINNPTKTGYTFTGWTPTGASMSETNLTIGASNVTLTANWTINTYTITYNLNGGTNALGNPTSGTYGTTITINNPTRAKYTFAGWTVTGASLNDNKLTMGASNVVLTAKWLEPPFSTDSWATIKAAVTAGNTSKYNVGDTKTVDLGSLGTHTVRIANKTPCDGTLASQTACGFVIEFADIISEQQMKSTSTNVGGWRDSAMRTYLNGDIYNALVSAIGNIINNTTVVSGYESGKTTNYTTTDKVYLLSTREVWGKEDTSNPVTYDTADGDTITRQLDYYKNNNVSTSSYSGAIKQKAGTNAVWWLRSANSSNRISDRFYNVNDSGDWDYYLANETAGVSPAFRLG